MEGSGNRSQVRRTAGSILVVLLSLLPAVAWGQACSTGNFGPGADAKLAAFITRFYQNVLERSPSAAEVAAHANFLKSNPTIAGFSSFTHAFFDGPENTAKPQTLGDRVTLLYRLLLGREPAAAERNAWVQVLRERFIAPLSGFVNSPEFQARLPLFQGRPSVEAEVARFYQIALLRSASQAEITAWSDFLLRNAGNLPAVSADVIAAIGGFFGSEEYLGISESLRDNVRSLYRTLLNREPAEAEVTAWTNFIVSQLAPVEDGFVNSQEFFAMCQSLFQ